MNDFPRAGRAVIELNIEGGGSWIEVLRYVIVLFRRIVRRLWVVDRWFRERMREVSRAWPMVLKLDLG